MEHGQALSQATSDPHHDTGNVGAHDKPLEKSNPNYIGVFVILGILTAIEIGLTKVFPPDSTVGTVPILLTLTVGKALLVILYYMHLKFDSKLYSAFFGVGVLAFGLPFVLALLFLISPPALTSQRQSGGNGGANGGTPAPTANPNAGPPVSFTVGASEFAYAPAALAANAGQVVRIDLKNTGSVDHTFVLASKTQGEDAQPWQTNDGKVIAKASSGGDGKGGFTAPGPGVYLFYCNVPGHAAAGMFGTLTVK